MKKEKVEKVIQKVYEKKDTHLNAPILTTVGRSELFLENYKGIIECNECCIKINTSIGIVNIIGNDLWVKEFRKECLKIFGKIENISFKG